MSLRNLKPGLTQAAFDKLLACLDADRERAGEKYVQVRAGLVRFFEWRGCPPSEDRADEVLNRVARKLDAGEEFRDLSTYVYGVARLMVLETQKEAARQRAALDSRPPPLPPSEEAEDLEPRADCLNQCLAALPPESRELITKYYQGETRAKIENRKRLAELLTLPLSTLRIRAFRLRERLAACVDECLKRH